MKKMKKKEQKEQKNLAILGISAAVLGAAYLALRKTSPDTEPDDDAPEAPPTEDEEYGDYSGYSGYYASTIHDTDWGSGSDSDDVSDVLSDATDELNKTIELYNANAAPMVSVPIEPDDETVPIEPDYEKEVAFDPYDDDGIPLTPAKTGGVPTQEYIDFWNAVSPEEDYGGLTYTEYVSENELPTVVLPSSYYENDEEEEPSYIPPTPAETGGVPSDEYVEFWNAVSPAEDYGGLSYTDYVRESQLPTVVVPDVSDDVVAKTKAHTPVSYWGASGYYSSSDDDDDDDGGWSAQDSSDAADRRASVPDYLF